MHTLFDEQEAKVGVGRVAYPMRGDAAATAFSDAARFYDREQHANFVAGWSRRQSLKLLRRYFKPGSRLLEIGCGTGEEAISLAREGRTIVATDAAAGMIRELERKLEGSSDLASQVKPLVLAARDLDQLPQDLIVSGFDGAYSSFGPLNCEPDLAPVASLLAQLVRPGGYVIISFINQVCPWEVGWHLLKGKPGEAFRRFRRSTLATVRMEWQETRVPVSYWPVAELTKTFARQFELVQLMALPWLFPPQYLSRLVERIPSLGNFLGALDSRTASLWPFNKLGDHVVLVLRRRGLEPPSTPRKIRLLRGLAKRWLRLKYRGFAPGVAPSRWIRSAGRKLWVEQGVFDPRLHYTSEYFAGYLAGRAREHVRGKRVLDLGTGSGLLALAAADGGASSVTAVDLNPAAIRSAETNVLVSARTSRVRLRAGDMFEAVRSDKFDVILTNPPYFRGEPNGEADRAYFAGEGLEWFSKLAEEAPSHLTAGGQMLMVLGDAAPIRDIFAPFLARNWQVEPVAYKHYLSETITIYCLEPTPVTPSPD
jgi:methylase of polypeptide subunit release factors